jgi:sulfur-oxidizing protein SoxX
MVRQHYHRNVWLTLALASLATFCLTAIGYGEDRPPPGLAAPLTDRPGDPKHGEALALDSETGDCVICHNMPIAGIQADAFGDIGPPLAGVGSRLTVAQLRQRVVNPKVIAPDTLMPGYFVKDGLNRVDRKYAGRTILSAQDVEDVVAYLVTLK